jgi:hypothetical protein
MHLVQLLLPLYYNSGNAFSEMGIRGELTERFGGVTAFTSAPAQGLWISEGGTTHGKNEWRAANRIGETLNGGRVSTNPVATTTAVRRSAAFAAAGRIRLSADAGFFRPPPASLRPRPRFPSMAS